MSDDWLRDFVSHRDTKARHPVQMALHHKCLSVTKPKTYAMVLLKGIQNLFSFKLQNSVKYVAITTQILTLKLAENYWLTLWPSKGKKECVTDLLKMLCRQTSFYERISVIFIIFDILVHISLIFHETWLLLMFLTLSI